MKVIFHINFHTVWGQKLCITGSDPALGSFEPALAGEMNYISDGNWSFVLDLPDLPQTIIYRYFLSVDGKKIFEEWDHNHSITLDGKPGEIEVYDYWQPKPSNLALYSSAFTQSLFAHPPGVVNTVPEGAPRLTIKIFAPRIEKGQWLAISGNQECLGDWHTGRLVRMDSTGFPEWTIQLDATAIRYPLNYKFAVIPGSGGEPIYWETGDNRTFSPEPREENKEILISGLFFRENQPGYRCAGTVIPAFSLRSEKSFGVGDLGDLKLMVDWVSKTHQRVIQVLPMNDTTMTGKWTDSYPYSAISIYALHPMYISLRELGELKDPEKAAFYKQKQIELNALPALDYEQVMHYKLAWLRDYFEQEKDRILTSEAFTDFVEEQTSWLLPYAAFCYFRGKYQTADFTRWEENAVYNRATVHTLCDKKSEAWEQIAFIWYQQFVLHTQFKLVTDYAREKGIILKGDLPIGVNRTSVETWTEPAYFNMNGQAGAPPDDFSTIGQNWGFPTYNWDLMELDQFAWWKKRFGMLENYFDCFRIDHILGFFRIWEIPLEYTQGLCGHFNPALPLSPEEIEQYGIAFQEEWYTQPRINRAFLPELFGDLAGEVAETWLTPASDTHYRLNCDTQQKIEAFFAGKGDTYSPVVKNGLLHIANEVLFLRDPYQTDKFHPRISGSHSFRYRELSQSDKYAFDQLYWNFFYHRHNEFWKEQAYKRLTPLVSGTKMLVCGEDLGMIPDSVPEVMNRLHILSLEIERMPKTPHREFTDMFNLPYLSVCTTSTHDMSPIRNWWKEDRAKTQRYYNEVLQRWGEAPGECLPDIAWQILSNHLKTRSMLVILPLQDWFAMDECIRNPQIEAERINVPANPKHYWRYRMHVTLEELIANDNFNNNVIQLINESNRK